MKLVDALITVTNWVLPLVAGVMVGSPISMLIGLFFFCVVGVIHVT